MRVTVIGAVVGTAMILAACGKTPEAPVVPLKKVESPAAGLPTAAVPKAAEAPQDGVHGGAMGGMPPGAPDDDVHKGVRAGMQGMAGMPNMPGIGDPNALPGHGMVAGDPSQADDGTPALRLAGLGSRAELDKALKDVEGDEAKSRFQQAFRWTFAIDKSQRDVEKARATFEDLLRTQPKLAPAYRGLAYVALSRGFDIDGAVAAYRKALEVKPDYAEVHYALAFLFSGSDLAKGRDHLKRALELGMPDEQGLKKVYGLE
jgi:hypothetical protein